MRTSETTQASSSEMLTRVGGETLDALRTLRTHPERTCSLTAGFCGVVAGIIDSRSSVHRPPNSAKGVYTGAIQHDLELLAVVRLSGLVMLCAGRASQGSGRCSHLTPRRGHAGFSTSS